MSEDNLSGNENAGPGQLRTKALSVDPKNIGPFKPNSHAKPDRVKVLDLPESDDNLIFKGCRSGNLGVLDMFCDCLYAKLGLGLEVPTPDQEPVYHDELGLGVISAQVKGEQGINAELSEVDNSGKIPILVTFEEWIVNHDDKEDHFWTVDEENTEIWMVDHGHVVPRNPHLTSAEDARESNVLDGTASNKNHFYQSARQVRPGIEMIRSIDEDELEETIDVVIEKFRKLASDSGRVDSFLTDAEGYKEATLTVLMERRDNIEGIMEDKYGD